MITRPNQQSAYHPRSEVVATQPFEAAVSRIVIAIDSSRDCAMLHGEPGQGVPVFMEPAKTPADDLPLGTRADIAVNLGVPPRRATIPRWRPRQIRYPSIVPEDFWPPPSFLIALACLRWGGNHKGHRTVRLD